MSFLYERTGSLPLSPPDVLGAIAGRCRRSSIFGAGSGTVANQRASRKLQFYHFVADRRRHAILSPLPI
jgi:hypothetical protein